MKPGPRAEISVTVRFDPDSTGEHGISGNARTVVNEIYYVSVGSATEAVEEAINCLESHL